MRPKKMSKKKIELDLSKSHYLGVNKTLRHNKAEDYYAYADESGNVHTTTDKDKSMTYDQIRKRVLENR